MRIRLLLFLLTLLIALGQGVAQKKPPQKPQTGKKPPAKTGQTQSQSKAGSIPVDQIDPMREQAGQMVRFFESTLNFLTDKRNTVKEKEIIITESYLKIFWDPEVQVEDDLDDNRLVPLYKDIPAYLTDVDFFFKRARFSYAVQDVSVQTNEAGQTFIRVTANRNISGQTLNGDSVNSNKVRYFEINYDDNKKQLKIASIYTTKLNERDDMRNWWNSLSRGWQELLGKDLPVGSGFNLSDVTRFNDTVATIHDQPQLIDPGQFYGQLSSIIGKKEINLSNNTTIADLEPLGKMSELIRVNLSGTPVSELLPLRNLNKLESLDISGSSVVSLDPLKYCNHIKNLDINGTKITDISLVAGFPILSRLNISNSGVRDVTPLKDLTTLTTLNMSGIPVTDIASLSGLVNLETLDITRTGITSLEPLRHMSKLVTLYADGAPINSIDPVSGLPALKNIYCDGCKIPRQQALSYMKSHPGVTVMVASGELIKWWSNMSAEWQKVFALYASLSTPPTKEQLHLLILVDSININGRQQISTLNPLMELVLLRVLYCSNTLVEDLMPLKPLDQLTLIQANNTKVNDLGPLSPLKKLELLSIENTGVSDLDPLRNLNRLKIVFADNSKITLQEANDFTDENPETLVIFQTYENNTWWKALSPAWQDIMIAQLNFQGVPDRMKLQQIANLDKVIINENMSVSDLTPLTYLSRLKELQFTGTSVAQLDPVGKMTKLQALRCSKNPILSLEPLRSLHFLKELDISNTSVEDLTPLQGLEQLEILKFSGTPVKKLKPIQGLTNLRIVEFYNTKISGLDELDAMRKLEMLKIFNTKISSKRVDKFKAAHPGCEVVYY